MLRDPDPPVQLLDLETSPTSLPAKTPVVDEMGRRGKCVLLCFRVPTRGPVVLVPICPGSRTVGTSGVDGCTRGSSRTTKYLATEEVPCVFCTPRGPGESESCRSRSLRPRRRSSGSVHRRWWGWTYRGPGWYCVLTFIVFRCLERRESQDFGSSDFRSPPVPTRGCLPRFPPSRKDGVRVRATHTRDAPTPTVPM